MLLVPTDLLVIGLDHFTDHTEMVSVTLETELDTEEEKESKEKDSKEKNKLIPVGLEIFRLGFMLSEDGQTLPNPDDHTLAHYLDIWTPPPELS